MFSEEPSQFSMTSKQKRYSTFAGQEERIFAEPREGNVAVSRRKDSVELQTREHSAQVSAPAVYLQRSAARYRCFLNWLSHFQLHCFHRMKIRRRSLRSHRLECLAWGHPCHDSPRLDRPPAEFAGCQGHPAAARRWGRLTLLQPIHWGQQSIRMPGKKSVPQNQ